MIASQDLKKLSVRLCDVLVLIVVFLCHIAAALLSFLGLRLLAAVSASIMWGSQICLSPLS